MTYIYIYKSKKKPAKGGNRRAVIIRAPFARKIAFCDVTPEA